MKHFNVEGLTRVTKKEARKLFRRGKLIWVCAHKVRPGSSYYYEFGISRNSITNDDREFDSRVDNYEIYNCNPNTGNYAAFYVNIEEV